MGTSLITKPILFAVNVLADALSQHSMFRRAEMDIRTITLLPRISLLRGLSTMIIHSLSRMIPSDNSNRPLCPVWALKYYLEHKKHFQQVKKRLFISYTNQLGSVTKNAMS